MLVRAFRPEKSWRALASVYSLPVDLANELEGPSAGAGTFIDFAESVELAVFVAPQSDQGVLPQLSAVVSLPLKPNTAEFLDFVAKKGATVERTERTRIVRDEQVCVLWAEGEHASRLLCSNSEPTLREVGPWLSSTALTKPSEDLQLSLDFAPLNADLKPKLTVVLNEQLGLLAGELVSPVFKEPPMSAKLVSGGQQLLAGLSDLGTLQASLRLDEGTGRLALNAELQYRSKESWLTRLWADDLRQGPPPGIFMQLPKDSEGAFFGRGFQQSQFVEPRAFIEHAWTKGIELLATQSDGRMRAADARSFAALIPALPHLDGEWAWAFGSVPVTLAKPASVPPTPQEEVQQFEARYRQALGWSVFAVGGEPKELLTFFERGIDRPRPTDV
jgi:hypothetical protein